jgi:hypothetical protein
MQIQSFLKIGYILLIVIIISQLQSFSQNVDSTLKVQMSILQTDNQTDNTTIEEMAQNIENLSHNPIDLNNAKLTDIEKLSMLSDFQISSLWHYLEKHRPILSIYELRAIMGFDSKDIETIKNYISCKPILKSKSEKVRNRMLVVEQYGESMLDDSVILNQKYQGKPTKSLVKIQSDIGDHFHISTIAEKDQGEHFGKQGFDYYSGNICIEKKYFIKKMILGDFTMHFGQGLVAWNVFTFSNITDIRKRGKGLMPYNSVDENQFLRGVGVTLGNQHWDFSFIASSHFVDGTIDSATNTITSLLKTGYHRTISEIANKHSVLQNSFGGDITYRFSKGRLGFTHVTHLFNKAIKPADKAYNLYSFSGKQMSVSGVNYFLNLKHADLFGEAAINERFRRALLCGGEFALTGFLQFSMLFRDYHPGFYTFMNSGFSANAKTTNERGLYWALRAIIDTSSSITATVDLYQHPWIQYGLYDVSSGSVTSVMYQRSIVNNGKVLLQYKYYSKPTNDTSTSSQLKGVNQFQENRLKAAIYSQLGIEWRFVSQAVCAFSDLKSSPSIYLSQDIDYYVNNRLNLSLRYSVFDASYDSRISVYESDVRVGSNATFYGEGDKFYLKGNYRLGKKLLFSAKYARLNKITNKIYSAKNEYSILVKCDF